MLCALSVLCECVLCVYCVRIVCHILCVSVSILNSMEFLYHSGIWSLPLGRGGSFARRIS